jgi:hypothetical protein
MKIDFSRPVEINGQPVQIVPDVNARLGDICRLAANAIKMDEIRTDMLCEEMLRRGRLAIRLSKCEEIDITTEEITTIKQSLPRVFNHPELFVVIFGMLED